MEIGPMRKYMSRQSDKKLTKQIRICFGWHEYLKVKAAIEQRTIRELVEASLSEWFGTEAVEEIEEIKRKWKDCRKLKT